MTGYEVWMVKYRTGKTLDDPEAWNIKTITGARARAYRSVSHKGINAKGEYKAKIYEKKYGLDIYCGEVVNTVSNQRYYYPQNGRKYELKSNGKLGRRLR